MFKSIPKTLLPAMCVAATFIANGATRSPEEAKLIAADFFKAEQVSRLANQDALTLVHVVNNGSLAPVSYVFNANDGKGFIIVSAETEAIPVIGYSFTNIWDPTAIPGIAQTILSESVFESYEPARRSTRAEAGEKLLVTPEWSQEAPFNNNIPNRRLTGCVGVALAEIMKYHNTPATRPSSLVNSGEDTAYDWKTMRMDNYRSGYSEAESNAVATLVADAAIGIGTDFGMSSSSAFEVKVPYALTSMFGYDAGVSYKKLSEISQNEWVDILVKEIEESRPVLFSGQDVSAGHAFVCDGYNTDASGATRLHFNWGWGGSANGYFTPGALNPVVSKAHSYNNLQTIVYNIKPATNNINWSNIHLTNDENQPGLTLDVTDITSADSFTVRAGSLKNISNTDFTGKLSIALFDESGKQKALLNDGRNFNLIALQVWNYVDFTGKVPTGVSVASTDVVRLVTMANGESEWRPVAGDLLVAGEARAMNGTLPYFAINYPGSSSSYTISYDAPQVVKGRDYTFKVVNEKSAINVITVKANGVILSPDASDNYKITNVLADQTITIVVQNKNDVVSTRILWMEAGNLKNLLDENETSSVKDLTLYGTMNAEDFTFIRERMKIERLDISKVTIVAQGSNPANAIPAKAFMSYRSLKQVLLPENLTTLKNACFGQTGLTSVEIPASVSTWEYNVFANSTALREVTVRRAAPVWINWCVFTNTPQAKLTVPVGSAAAYGAKDYWKDFKEIIEENPTSPSTYKVTIADNKDITINPISWKTEFPVPDPSWGIYAEKYEFQVETAPNLGDAILEVYANNSLLSPRADGAYEYTINSPTVIHVNLRQPEPTTIDKTWKITGADGGVGLVSEIINAPLKQNFTVRANAIKVPAGNDASKFFAMVLTDKNGAIKEFISQVFTNMMLNSGNVLYNFTCNISKSTIKEGNEIRLATSYNKKNWELVTADSDTVTDRISAIGNRVVYHTITMPQTVNGANIEGAATQIVRGMPFNLKVTPVAPTQRVTVAVNGINKAVSAAVANVSIPAVLEDLEVSIQVNDADASDYVVVNVSEGQLASKIAECPDRLKLVGTINSSDFDAFRAHAGNIVDLDLSDVTIKGVALTTANAIPENAFAPALSTGSSALRTIILPAKLERIYNNAFARCLALTSITIPASVNYVGTSAFSQCTSLKEITMEGTVPPLCGNMSPFPANASAITLHVPAGYETDYSNASFWNSLSIYKEEVPKEYYWVKYDPERIGIWWNGGHDLNHIGVGIAESSPSQEVRLVLPNNQRPAQIGGENNQLRTGVAFKLYDNGFEIISDLAKGTVPPYTKPTCPYNFEDIMQSGYKSGGVLYLKWMPNQLDHKFYKPQNHDLEVVFYYPISFEFLEGAAGSSVQFVNLGANDRWQNVSTSWFDYNADEVRRDVYKENTDIQFKINPPGGKDLSVSEVKLKHKIMTKSGKNPVYEEKELVITPDATGVYTIPQLPGETWVSVTGESHVRVNEGDVVNSSKLEDVQKEQVEEFTELTVSGEVTEEAFEALREKFESVETLNLSQISNTSIPENALAGLENLRTVFIPETITEIGAGAFQGCENIETLTLPGVNTIGEGAFEGCTSLTSLIIPSSNTESATRAAADGINADSFKGLNPNCLIYLGTNDIPNAEHLNIILAKDGKRVAASNIVLDSEYPFNAPTGFNLGEYTISYTAHIPGSFGADVDGGWRGIMLPFTPSEWAYGVEFGERRGSGLQIISLENDAETMTTVEKFEANKPYLAHVVAPFESVPVTFVGKALANDENESTQASFDNYDIVPTPNPEDVMIKGKDYTLYGSFDGETVLGECLALNEDGSKFMASDSIKIGAFSAYICLNEGTTAQEFPVGEHAIWVQEPYGAGVSGTKLYRGDKIELTTKTKNATIYYTTDGSDPSDAEGTRMVYDAPIEMIGESMSLQAMAVFKDFSSENVDLNFELKKVDIDYDLAPNWNWISHNMENEVAVADFATEGISRILSQTQEVVRDPKLGLSGNLKTLLPGTGYKVCVASEKNAAAKIAGVAFNPQGAVKLHSGWNWIGCPVDDASLAVADLLANLEAEEGDMIVGLEGFQQADAEGNWTGTLPVLATGAGYLYFSNSDKEFTYNFVKGEPAEASAEEPATRTLEETPWVVDIHRYANVMPMTAVAVDADGFDADVEDYMIAAFCGKECRGIAQVVDGKYMINIHGNAGDNISFRFINAEGAEYVTSSNIIFKELPVGSVSEPYVIKLNILSAVNSIEADGLEIVSENGAIVVKGDLAGNASVEVFDLAGTRLAASSANNGAVSVNGLEPGIRLIVVRTGSDIIYRKVMVK